MSNIKKEIAVIGRGIIGLCSAFHLQKKGCKVTLFGPNTQEIASYAAVGIISSKGLSYPKKRLFKDKVEGSSRLLNFINKIQKISKTSINYKVSGVYEYFHSTYEYQYISERIYHGDFTGCYSVKVYNHEELRHKGPLISDFIGSKGPPMGALFYPKDYWVEPSSLLKSLDKALFQLQVQIVPEMVNSIDIVHPQGFLVNTKQRNFKFDDVLLACGASTPDVLGKLTKIDKFPFQTVPGQTLVGSVLQSTRSGALNYKRQGLSIFKNRLRFGSIDFPKNCQPSKSDLARGFRELNKTLEHEFGVKNLSHHSWHWGTRLTLKDRRPLIGPLDISSTHKIWINSGFHKNAFTLCDMAGEEIANQICNLPPLDHDSFYSPKRFL